LLLQLPFNGHISGESGTAASPSGPSPPTAPEQKLWELAEQDRFIGLVFRVTKGLPPKPSRFV